MLAGGGELIEIGEQLSVGSRKHIESLLRARAEQAAAPVTDATCGATAKLRVETIALLGRMRSALVDELGRTPDVVSPRIRVRGGSGRELPGDLLHEPLAFGVALDVTAGVHGRKERTGAAQVLELGSAVALLFGQPSEEFERFDQVEGCLSAVRVDLS